MQSTIFDIGGRKVVFGLRWEMLDETKNESAALKQICRETNSSFHIQCETKESTIYGLLSDESVDAYREQAEEGTKAKKTKSEQYISASALFAELPEVEKEAIWVEIVGKNARMAALMGGAPSPEGDFSGTLDEVRDRIDQIRSGTDLQFVFYGDGEEWAESYFPLSLVEMMERSNIELATLITSDKGMSSNIKLIAILAVVALGFFGFTQYQKMAEKKKMEELQRSHQQESPQKKYEAALNDAKTSVGIVSSEVLNVLFSESGKLKDQVAGWKLSNVSCDVQNCTYKWTKTYGDYRSLAEALGKDIHFEYENSGAEVTYKIPTKNRPTKAVDFDKLPPYNEFMLETGSFAQNLRLIGIQPTLAPPTVFPETSGVDVSVLASPVKAGKLDLTANLGLLQDIVAKLPDNVSFTKLDIKLGSEEPSFSLEGKYYVRN